MKIPGKNTYYQDLVEIFKAAVESVNPYKMIKNAIKIQNSSTIINPGTGEFLKIDLKEHDKILVFGTGKATAPMARAIEEILNEKISGGLISVKYGYTENLQKIKIIEAGHPIPDENSIKAAEEMLKFKNEITEKTVIINLISGGGSALLELPLSVKIKGKYIELTLKDIQEVTRILLETGATIDEINCIRKHISSIKGGRFSKLFYPAWQINLILSDVVGDRLDSIASGLTTWDDTTYRDAYSILTGYNILDKIPSNVKAIIIAGIKGEIEETPKRDDPVFERVKNLIIGSNYTALKAAAREAVQKGYKTTILSSEITGEAREIAKVYTAISADIIKHSTLSMVPACVIGGGETTVTVTGNGIGGRNQELALSFLNEILKRPSDFRGVYFLSASTDGSDGPTDADGAFASLELAGRAKELSLDPHKYLKENDSYNFFKKIGGLFITGPTNTNVCDLQIAIIVDEH